MKILCSIPQERGTCRCKYSHSSNRSLHYRHSSAARMWIFPHKMKCSTKSSRNNSRSSAWNTRLLDAFAAMQCHPLAQVNPRWGPIADLMRRMPGGYSSYWRWTADLICCSAYHKLMPFPLLTSIPRQQKTFSWHWLRGGLHLGNSSHVLNLVGVDWAILILINSYCPDVLGRWCYHDIFLSAWPWNSSNRVLSPTDFHCVSFSSLFNFSSSLNTQLSTILLRLTFSTSWTKTAFSLSPSRIMIGHSLARDGSFGSEFDPNVDSSNSTNNHNKAPQRSAWSLHSVQLLTGWVLSFSCSYTWPSNDTAVSTSGPLSSQPSG